MAPSVSINLCCYNSERYLRETLDSIINQTYKDWELIIINDGSTDSTEPIIHEYIKQGYPIIYHYQENKGLGFSRNEALKRSQGKYIAFIDHDDLWMPKKLEKQIPLFDDPEVGLVFCDTIFFNEKGKSRRDYSERKYLTGWCFSELLTDYFLSMPAVVIRRAVLDGKDVWFDQRFNICEEADLFRRIAYKWKLSMVNEPLAKWRVHSSSLTWTSGHLFYEETLQMLDNFHDIFPEFGNRFAKEISLLKRQITISKALCLWRSGDSTDARWCLVPYLFSNMKAFVVFFMTLFPPNILTPLAHRFRKDIVPE